MGRWTVDRRRWINQEHSMETVVTSRGRVVIPSKIRRQLGIKEGIHFQVEVDGENKKIILTPITREYVDGLRSKYKGKA